MWYQFSFFFFPHPWEIPHSLSVRNFSFASIIETGPLGHLVGVVWPVSHPRQLSTFYEAGQECIEPSQMVWRGEKLCNGSER